MTSETLTPLPDWLDLAGVAIFALCLARDQASPGSPSIGSSPGSGPPG
jgi:hypothetical protein